MLYSILNIARRNASKEISNLTLQASKNSCSIFWTEFTNSGPSVAGSVAELATRLYLPNEMWDFFKKNLYVDNFDPFFLVKKSSLAKTKIHPMALIILYKVKYIFSRKPDKNNFSRNLTSILESFGFRLFLRVILS